MILEKMGYRFLIPGVPKKCVQVLFNFETRCMNKLCLVDTGIFNLNFDTLFLKIEQKLIEVL